MTDKYLLPFILGLLSGAIVVMIIAGIFVKSDSKENTMSAASDQIVCIGPASITIETEDRIIYDKRTKVMYISRGAGSAYTPMYEADGSLKTWKGE